MKVFLVNFLSPILIEAAKELKKRSVDIVYWIGNKKDFDDFVAREGEKFPTTIFHGFYDAIKGIGAREVDCSGFEPPGADLIQEMLECESITLSMMPRFYWKNISFLKKKHLYHKYLQYWNGVIKKLKPDVIIFRRVPHAGFNYVIYCLAKKYHIPTMMFDFPIFPDRLILMQDFQKPPRELYEMYNKVKNEIHSIKDISPESQLYFKKLTNPECDATPVCNKKLLLQVNDPPKVIPPLKKIIKNIKSGQLLAVSRYHLKSIINATSKMKNIIDESDKTDYSNIFHLKRIKKITDKYKKEYRQLQSEADYSKKYIYLPLHYQPECSTSPVGGFFVDQVLMIKILSAAVPPDWLIYVKEYTVQWNYRNPFPHLCRHQGYYKEIADLKNARLIAPETSTYDLLHHARAVATVAGTAGWEALARKKPVLIFGYPWYMFLPGAFQVSDVKTCQEAIKKIREGCIPDPHEILNYLIALERTAVKANMHRVSYRQMDEGESAKNITKAIMKELEEQKNIET